MATSKTLAPTNVTIQIPEFTDQPDQRVNSNCLDKEADAINALNTAISFETITSGNFNSYTASGGKVKHYCGSNVNSFTNAPSGLSNYAFALDVFQVGTDSTYTKQVLHFYGATPATFERQQYWSSGVQWGAWQQLALKSDIQTYQETVSVTSGYFVLRGIPSGKKLFITNEYVSGASSQNTALIFSVQPDPTNNRYIVYVRKGDGSVPTDTDLTIDILAV